MAAVAGLSVSERNAFIADFAFCIAPEKEKA
jgi:hypothetical protein